MDSEDYHANLDFNCFEFENYAYRLGYIDQLLYSNFKFLLLNFLFIDLPPFENILPRYHSHFVFIDLSFTFIKFIADYTQ